MLLTRSDDLQILIAVVDSGSFSAAAETLNIQVAKVSRAVSKIEKQLGATLLNRTTRRIELTDEGRDFVETVRNGIKVIQQAEEEVITRGELPKGHLRVDAASPFVFHQLVPLVSEFKSLYPDIDLEITSNEGFVDLIEKRTDIAIRIGKLSDSTLHAKPLGKSLLYMVAAPSYLEKRGIPVEPWELKQHDLIGFSGVKVLNKWPFSGDNLISPSITSSNGETVRQLALQGNGIACLSGFMVNKDIEQGRLIPILEEHKLTNTGREQVSAVYYRSSSPAKKLSAFIDFIQPRLNL
ncbi:LysR family transcriptional regulator [Vibrio ishigakensis]|uniref:LysR family transcriptional regulator n=1 Tax=Vibrio ishigakensis TaxID=1481914 RepID=UPI0021C376E7|nr:LysR family transcriptional regulator [Vibrio ishigakensis]